MQNKKNLNSGFIGLLVLLISVALIILFIVRTDIFKGEEGSKNIIEEGQSAVDKAKEAKNLIEQNSKKTAEF